MSLIISPELQATVNEAFAKLLRTVQVYDVGGFEFAQALNNGYGVGGVAVPLETTAAITYYVESTGSDENDGSLAKPFKTIQRAVDMVPKRIKHPVVINVGAGTFDGFALDGITIQYASTGSYIGVIGTLTTHTPSAGIAGGTATGFVNGSNATRSSITIAGAGWTVDALKGKLMRVLSGGGYTNDPTKSCYVISANTADTVTVLSNYTTFDGSTAIDFCDWGTAVRPNLKTTSGMVYGSTANTCVITNVIDSYSPSDSGGVFLSRLNLDAGADRGWSYGFGIQNGRSDVSLCKTTNIKAPVITNKKVDYDILLRRCVFYGDAAQTNARMYCLGSGNVTIYESYYSMYGWGVDNYKGATYIYASIFEMLGGQAGFYGGGANVSIGRSTLTAPAGTALQVTGFSPSKVGNGQVVSISYCDFSGSAVGLKVGGASNCVQASSLIGTGNTTGIQALNGANVYLNAGCTITGATEISLDGVSHTLAEMRANNPKYLTNATTGTRVWGD